MRRFGDDEFGLDTKATLGVDFTIRKLYIGRDVIRVQIWDTGRYCITWSLAHIGVIMCTCVQFIIEVFFILSLL